MITNKELPALIKRAHDSATAHGFQDKPKSAAHWLMLIITEISEMVEADRRGKHADKYFKERIKEIETEDAGNIDKEQDDFYIAFITRVKNSVEDELADIWDIRLCRRGRKIRRSFRC